jgi:hypothetical protein
MAELLWQGSTRVGPTDEGDGCGFPVDLNANGHSWSWELLLAQNLHSTRIIAIADRSVLQVCTENFELPLRNYECQPESLGHLYNVSAGPL